MFVHCIVPTYNASSLNASLLNLIILSTRPKERSQKLQRRPFVRPQNITFEVLL